MSLITKTKTASLKYFNITFVFTIFISVVMVFSFLAQQQNNTASHLLSLLPVKDEKIQFDKLKGNKDYFVGLANISELSVNSQRETMLTIKGSIKPLFTRIVITKLSSIEHSHYIIITFVHPLWIMFSSIVFLSSMALFILGAFFIRRRFTTKISEELQVVNDLEVWANKCIVTDSIQPLRIKNKRSDDNRNIIVDSVINLQEELNKTQQDKHLFDQELREKALLDPVTGIGTRDFFKSHLAALLLEEDSRGAVFLVQLKGCELVQNLYGEAQAIHLLETTISTIKNTIITINDCFLSRCGEFELSILVPDLYVNQVEKLAGRLLKNLLTISLPIGVSQDEFCHVGISYFKRGSQLYQVMSEADMALRSAQLQGPSQWFMYDPGEIANETAIGSLKWRTFLTHVINKKAFVIFSQQVISSDSHKVLSYEIFSKVKNRRGELIGPRIFLPMAEKCGLSLALDFMVFEKVCEQIKSDGYLNTYSLNFSLDALLSLTFREQLFEMLNEDLQLITCLILEVSEYHIKSRKNELLPILQLFKNNGLSLLSDKVGQYIVNAKYLKECQISYVKLHRSIVLDIHEKAENQMFVQSMKVLCEPLNIKIFAVGVETIDEWTTLKKIGIDGGQGHFFEEPIPQLVNTINH